MIYCAKCDRPSTQKWTINNGRDAAILDLCNAHSRELNELMELGRVDAGREALRLDITQRRPRPHRRRGASMQAFDWKPPKE